MSIYLLEQPEEPRRAEENVFLLDKSQGDSGPKGRKNSNSGMKNESGDGV